MSERPMTRSPAPTDPSTAAAKRARERRTYWIAAIAVFGSIAVLTTASIFTASSYGPRKDTNGQLQEDGGAKPHIIPRPGEGQAPKHPNDRGGWQQFLVLGLIIAAVGAIGGLAWRSSVRARARFAATPPGAETGAGRVGAAKPPSP